MSKMDNEKLDHLILEMWTDFIDLKNKKNAYYSMPVLTDETYIGETFVAPMTFATACISRNKGNYISTILLNCMEDMGIQLDSKVK